ncbi:hypothetical protein GE061_014935 [Apolygus lucorum]|uniref:Uncharacterized protein n=1 Tax=Apolygus lucorum TaxID=248454 RepID=A0A8S9XJG1_APOLU|nr:hypothetical protein GE061_014935 [Apolygus lucorum]
MSRDAKKMFVCGTVKPGEVKRRFAKEGDLRKQRGKTYQYFLKVNEEYVPVCKTMYLSSLGLRENEVRYWLENFEKNNVPINRRDAAVLVRAENDDAADDVERLTSKSWNDRREFLSKFFDELPTMPSHYCRKNTRKLYLQTDITSWTQLYNLYRQKCKQSGEEVPLSRFTFDQQRKKKNVDIFIPKKDRCDLCASFEHGHVSPAVYEAHQRKKELAREEKNKDKKMAEDGVCHTIVLDLMKVQTSPWLRASAAYYKLKLVVHNYTVQFGHP